MALLVSPDGTETFDAPDSLVKHYVSKGAKPYVAPEPTMGENIAATAGAATEALGSLPRWGLPVGTGLGGLLLARAFRRGGTSTVKLTAQDIANIPEFSGNKAGDQVRRVTYEKFRYGPNAIARANATKGPAPSGPTGLVPPPEPGPTTQEMLGMSKAQGAEHAMKLQRAREFVRVRRAAALFPELEASARPPVTMGPRGIVGKLPGALGLIATLLDAGSLPQQIDEAGKAGRRFLVEERRRKGEMIPAEIAEEMINGVPMYRHGTPNMQHDVSAQLRQSLDFEHALAKRGFTPNQIRALRHKATSFVTGGNP